MLTRTHRFLPTSLTFFTRALSCVVTVSRVRAVLQELDLIAGPQPLSDCEQNTAISTKPVHHRSPVLHEIPVPDEPPPTPEEEEELRVLVPDPRSGN
jgi:hypothetical protein